MVHPSVLVVDDDITAIQLVGHILTGAAEVRFARSGEAALQLVLESPPDLILLDVDMPGIDGFETCRRLKADRRTAAIPVIFVTSFGDERSELAAMEVGAADFLSKPLTATQVLARVQAHWRVQRQIASILHHVEHLSFDAESQPKPLILIVDDDKSAIQALHLCLKDSGAEFVFARDGVQALKAARDQRPDLVLLDIMMPHVDGVEVARKMREDSELAFVPIVVVTRYADPDMEARALDAGATDFIGKPYSEPVLQARVRNALRLKFQADAARRIDRERWRQLSDARLADVIDAASDAIITLDAQGEVQLMNRAALQLLEVSAAKAIGHPLSGMVPGTVLAEAAPDDLADDDVQHAHKVDLVRHDGSSIPVEWCRSDAGSGTERLTTLILRDQRERERAEQSERERIRLEAESQTKTMMMGFIAHEFGNPLNGVLGLSHLALSDKASPLSPAQRQRIEQIAACGNLMLSLMKDVMDVSRIEAGKFDVDLCHVDLPSAVARAVQSVASQAELTGVRVSTVVLANAIAVADPTRLHQCLVNLLSNAIKYNRPQGYVEIRVNTESGGAILEVEDTGLGMTEEQVAHLFEPFNRLGRARAAHGYGIGLVLTKLLVTAMQGRLEVSSIAGQGTCFRLTLPAAAAQ